MSDVQVKFRLSFEDEYRKSLDTCYNLVKQDNNYPNRIIFAIMAVAYIEQACNNLIIELSEAKFDNATSYAKDILGLTLKSKLQMSVLLATDNASIIETNHNIVQSLFTLISIRNKLIHKQDHYKPPILDNNVSDPNIRASFTFTAADETIEKLKASEIDKFYTACVKYVDNTLNCYKINRTIPESDFIIKNSKKSA